MKPWFDAEIPNEPTDFKSGLEELDRQIKSGEFDEKIEKLRKESVLIVDNKTYEYLLDMVGGRK